LGLFNRSNTSEEEVFQDRFPYSIFQYIVDEEREAQDEDEPIKLPPMDDLARKLGVSRGKLREELIAAQAYGVVEMRPGDGTYVRPFDFYTAIRTLVLYSIARDRRNFDCFYELRVQLETAFWEKAARSLSQGDLKELQQLLERAERKLRGTPVEIPHREHRNFHLLIFSRLGNEFVQGLLRAYWDAYESVGLHLYFDYSYYEEMWVSHRGMVEAIVAGRYEEGKEILIQHATLLQSRLQVKNDGQ
jgi:GntR family transcriptional repressor for pyruvate dehydrogenase complex